MEHTVGAKVWRWVQMVGEVHPPVVADPSSSQPLWQTTMLASVGKEVNFNAEEVQMGMAGVHLATLREIGGISRSLSSKTSSLKWATSVKANNTRVGFNRGIAIVHPLISQWVQLDLSNILVSLSLCSFLKAK